jgi:hypothetical protein
MNKCLKWARENGCPWDENVCTDAAQYGHLDILKWAGVQNQYFLAVHPGNISFMLVAKLIPGRIG